MADHQPSIVDISPSLNAPLLEPRDGTIRPIDRTQAIVETYLLAHWFVTGQAWPQSLREIYVNGDLYTHVHGNDTIWLATIVFVNGNVSAPSFGFGKTFRVDFPNGQYDRSFDDDLRMLLQQQLLTIE